MKSRYKPEVIDAVPLSLFKQPLTTRYSKLYYLKVTIFKGEQR
jgi:hypothetical protein